MEAKQFIYFKKLDWGGMKTEKWGVFNTRSDYMIATIEWLNTWRQYCFYPTNDTHFNPDCLEYIAAKCRELTTEHREKLKTKRLDK